MQNSKKDSLIKIFQKAEYEPAHDLASSVLQNVINHEKRNSQFKLWIFSAVEIISFVLLIPAFINLSGSLARSGFSQYFSIIFSDGASALSYWKELFFSLAESLPTLSIIMTMTLVFICFLSLKKLMNQISENQLINSTSLSA